MSRAAPLVLLALLCGGLCLVGAIEESHVRFVDYSPATRSFLFRSGILKNDTDAVDLDALHALFTQRAAAANLTFFRSPADYALVDVNLLTTETDDIAAERAYYAAHPSVGSLVLNPIWGIGEEAMQAACAAEHINKSRCAYLSRQPEDFRNADRAALARDFLTRFDSTDQLHALVGNLHDWLTTSTPLPPSPAPSAARGAAAAAAGGSRALRHHHRGRAAATELDSRPRVLLVHCECGCDRTGQVMASYMMRFFNSTFTDAMTYDEGVPDRHICYENQVMTQWYCEYLHAQHTIVTADCGRCEPFTCEDLGC